ncbi:MAG: hypothetical protein Q9M40_05570 [Sulfurimonas sp.]|nr:hypothetical protein [Sulfurimonas sp.]
MFEDVSAKMSDEYLCVLIENYTKSNTEYESKKVNLKTKLDRLNSLKNSQNEIEINFKFDAFNESFFISKTPNILSMLDDIFEFKNKKLEMVKSSGHNRFRSFVNSEMPTKMSIFNDGEDKFISSSY